MLQMKALSQSLLAALSRFRMGKMPNIVQWSEVIIQQLLVCLNAYNVSQLVQKETDKNQSLDSVQELSTDGNALPSSSKHVEQLCSPSTF